VHARLLVEGGVYLGALGDLVDHEDGFSGLVEVVELFHEPPDLRRLADGGCRSRRGLLCRYHSRAALLASLNNLSNTPMTTFRRSDN
jgi:hypothetical protein